jgi:hypothetical protein
MKNYTCYDAGQIFKEYSFLKYFKEFDLLVFIYPKLDGREDYFILIIEDQDNYKNCAFLINARNKKIIPLEYINLKNKIKEKEEFYEIKIKSKIKIDENLNIQNFKEQT